MFLVGSHDIETLSRSPASHSTSSMTTVTTNNELMRYGSSSSPYGFHQTFKTGRPLNGGISLHLMAQTK